MKKIILSFLLLTPGVLSFATVFNVTVSNFQFSPSNIPNVVVGDVVKFNWGGGSHTTTCDPASDPTTSLPAGAATWDSPMNSSSTTFSYTVTTPGVYNFVCLPHSSFMKGSFTVSAALPVILTSFNVTKQEGNSLIQWSTSSEENSNYFSVTRSFTGRDFEEIAKVPASGNSAVSKSYSYVDKISPTDNHQFIYYLLSIIDKDGKKNYSNTVLLKGGGNASKMILSLTPNPVQRGGHVMIDFNAAESGTLTAEVFSTEGQSVLKTSLSATKGVNMGHIHLHDLPAGTYTIKFILKDQSESFKILVK